ncbi:MULTISPECIES: hypothetical protein [Cupriavidus]|uniref:hypothetical protein n=1 Tax=Cupriavidus TaxID=106589 RepID=UPI0025A7E2B0|nr:hypothetical protein [Cupriavidus sp. TKC]GMG91441.1 hypothetical protein Cmtc_26610 [Cupriavidus sp. TKC]
MNTDTYEAISQHDARSYRRKMGLKAVAHALSLGIGSAALLTLAGCGGSGDGTTAGPDSGLPTTQPAATSNISGKAIDGYLVGAKVCLDTNDNGVCDAGEPNTTTNADGSYNLVAEGAVIGKKLLVVVDANTKDLSRPNYSFPASFTLSSVVSDLQGQNVTPLTTMQIALVEGGKGADTATKTVIGLVGGAVNLAGDYIANGNTAAATFAASVVDKVVEIASTRSGDGDTVRAVMNAIATKGSVAAVTVADVDAARAKPVYLTDVDANQMLATPSYAVAGLRWEGLNSPIAYIVRQTFALQGGTLVKSYDQMQASAASWVSGAHLLQDVTHNFGQFSLKADGTWSAYTPLEDVGNNLQFQSVSGNVVQAFDGATGRNVKLEFRRTDLSNKSFVNAMPTGSATDTELLARMPGAFPAGTNGYAVIASYSTDTIAMVSTDHCGAGASMTPPRCLIGNSSTTYTSVQDVLTMGPIGFGPMNFGYLNFDATTGAVTLRTGAAGNAVMLDSSKISWAPYMGRQDLIVFNVKADDLIVAADAAGTTGMMLNAAYDNYQSYRDLVKAGAKFGIALLDGKLSWVIITPAGTEQLTLLNKDQGFNALTPVLKQAILSGL